MKAAKIQVTTEVSLMLLWITAGVGVVSISYLIPRISTEYWPALNAAGIAAGAYFLVLVAYIIRSLLERRFQIIVGIMSFLVFLSTAVSWTITQEHSEWSKHTIMRVRGTIGRNIMSFEMQKHLLPALEQYHLQKSEKRMSIGKVFQTLHPNGTTGSNIHEKRYEGDELRVFIRSMTSDKVVLVSQESYVPGRNPNFQNHDGRKGMVQETFVLTEKGITHVSEN